MALIQCPNCGESISDKAIKCVHCGYDLVHCEKHYCVECGEELDPEASVCPKCGCPVTKEEEISETVEESSPQQVEVTGVRVPKKSKMIIGILALIVILIVAGAFGFQQMQKQNEAKEAERISQEYKDNYETAAMTMLAGAIDAEESGTLIRNVWYNSIYKEADEETDPYTRPNGVYLDDFNDALANLFADGEFTKKIDSIKKNRDEVQSLMKELKNPPDEYKEAYDELSDLYDAYTQLTNVAVDPSGNLQSYTNSFNEADTSVANSFSSVRLYIDDM